MPHQVKTLETNVNLPNGHLYPLVNTVVTLSDEDFAQIGSAAIGVAVQDLGEVAQMGTVASVGQSVAGAQWVQAPAAFAAVVSLPSNQLPAGRYRIRVWAGYAAGALGAPEQAAGGNHQLFVGANVVTKLSIPPILGLYGPFTYVVNLDGATTLATGGPATGTATAWYMGKIIADLLSGPETVWAI